MFRRALGYESMNIFFGASTPKAQDPQIAPITSS